MRKASFAPFAAPDTRILVLGSLPGEASLRAGEYYAHKQNQFWRLMEPVVGTPLHEQDFETKKARLRAARVGLWDVVAHARREGSLDGAIRDHAPNALDELIATLPDLRAIAFNGKTAARIGERQIARRYHELFVRLPSSSPAYTAPFAVKQGEWLKLKSFLG